jgi:hypothetical protein
MFTQLRDMSASIREIIGYKVTAASALRGALEAISAAGE